MRYWDAFPPYFKAGVATVATIGGFVLFVCLSALTLWVPFVLICVFVFAAVFSFFLDMYEAKARVEAAVDSKNFYNFLYKMQEAERNAQAECVRTENEMKKVSDAIENAKRNRGE